LAGRHNNRRDFTVSIFKWSRQKVAANTPSRERRTYQEPAMDRELPLVFFAAAVAAMVLVAIQVQSSSDAQKHEAASHKAYRAAQHQSDSRLASSQIGFSDAFAQRIR
jgi:hypothetical protein